MKSVSNSGAADPLEVSKFLDFLRFCNRGAEKRVYKEELCHH
jgi:hypothetical protein